MLIGLGEIADDGNRFDYCVVGTGPAGMSLAIKLGRSGRKVLLLEGGDDGYTEESQAVYNGANFGDIYHGLDWVRLRAYGGTSGHWSGWCRTLDEVDFLPKPAFHDARWPIRKADLDAYYDQAAEILELPQIPGDDVLSDEQGIKQINFVFSPPVHFALKYEDEVEASDNIFLCLKANVTSVNTDGGKVTDLDVEDYDGNRTKARAGAFVLATGGIENSRLLLWSQEKNDGRLIDAASPLGRYWMEHPHFTIGQALVDASLTSEERLFFSLTQEKQLELGVLNCGLRLAPTEYDDSKKLIADLACVAPDLGIWTMRQLNKDLVCGAILRAAWEQEPRIDNRIQLSASEKDRFGMPRSELYWRKSFRDLETVRKSALQFADYLIASGKGRIKLEDWVLGQGDYPENDELIGYHHMGGTRMADGPGQGVVDSDCKVFGQDNLYITGSSIFPSGGHANPTLTIVQLAVRLADHLVHSIG